MQTRIVAFSPMKAIRKEYKLDGGWHHYRFRYYVAPGKELAVVRAHEDGQRHLEMMKWGKAATVSISEVAPGNGQNAGLCVIPISMYLLHDVDADHELMPQQVLVARHFRPISIAGVWRVESGQRHCAVITGTNDMPIALRPGGAMKWLDLKVRHSKKMSMLTRVDLPHGVKVVDGGSSVMPIPSEEMIIEDIPSVDACKSAKFAFALTLSGYSWWADGEGPERLCRARWIHEETGQWPGDLLLMRNALFHLQRSMHNQGDYSERDYMEYCDLLESIRRAVSTGAQDSVSADDGNNLFFAKQFRRAIAFSRRVSWPR